MVCFETRMIEKAVKLPSHDFKESSSKLWFICYAGYNVHLLGFRRLDWVTS